MPQAKITVNAVVGSNVNLPINTLVQLDNQNTGGEVTYTWSILDQPPGPVDSLSSVSAQNPFFTPRKEGTYLLRLIVNQSLPTEQEDRVVCAVEQVKTGERIPAAGETTEADTSDGWATAMNSLLRRMDTLIGDPGIFTGVNASGGTLTRGDVLRATASSVIKAGLPGQETIPGMSKALANVVTNVDEPLVVLEGTIAGASSVPNGALMRFRILGRYAANVGGGSATVGDSVYVTDTGTLSLTPGTTRRKVGSAMTAGTTYDVWFAGVGGEDITPIDRAYVVYGNPGMLTNAFRVDGTSASAVTSGVPFMIKAGDDTTVTFALRRNSGSGLSIQQWQTEGGTVLSSIDVNGNLVFATTARKVAWPTVNVREESADTFGIYDGTTLYADFLFSASAAFLRLYGSTMAATLAMDSSVPAFQIRSDASTTTPIDFFTNGVSRWRIDGSTGALIAQGATREVQNITNSSVASADLTAVNRGSSYGVSRANRNLIINGGFDFWQRVIGTTTTVQPLPTVVYTADRWGAAANVGTGNTILRVNPLLGGFQWALRFKRTPGDTDTSIRFLSQEIDRQMLKSYLKNTSNPATVTFWCRVGASFSGTIAAKLWAGSGAEVNNRLVGGYTNQNQNFTSTAFSPTTSWQQFTFQANAISDSASAAPTQLSFEIAWTPAGTAGASDQFDIVGVMLTPQQSVTPSVFVPAGGSSEAEQALAERYYEKSYDLEIAPGFSTNFGFFDTNVLAQSTTNTQDWPFGAHPRFRVSKWQDPVLVLLWSGTGTSSQWSVGGASTASSATNASQSGFTVANNTGGTVTPTAGRSGGHYSADAEFY